MQRKASKYLFSTLKAHVNNNLNNPSSFLYVPLAYFSSNNPRRGTRNENVSPDDFFPEMGTNRDNNNNRRSDRGGRSKNGDSGSDEFFPDMGRNRDNNRRSEREERFGDPGPDDFFPEMGKNCDLGGKNRRIEGEGRVKGRFGNSGIDDFFPEMGRDRDLGRKNQRIEGEGRNRERFVDSSESEDEEEVLSSPQIQTSDPQFDRENKKNEKVKPLSTTGESLFEKLKLGEKKDEESQSEPTQMETNESMPPHQPPQEADEIFKKMKETGLIPNAVSMLDGLCKDGLVNEAMKLFSLMREKGTIPEVVIYTAVVDGFCKAGKLEDGKRIFRKMQKNGIIPNAYSYGLIINWLCNYEKLDDCVDFCEEMFEAGHVLNAESFVKVVDKVCEVKGRGEGERIVRGFEKRNFAIDEKSIREYLDKKGPFDSSVEDVIFGNRGSRSSF